MWPLWKVGTSGIYMWVSDLEKGVVLCLQASLEAYLASLEGYSWSIATKTFVVDFNF